MGGAGAEAAARAPGNGLSRRRVLQILAGVAGVAATGGGSVIAVRSSFDDFQSLSMSILSQAIQSAIAVGDPVDFLEGQLRITSPLWLKGVVANPLYAAVGSDGTSARYHSLSPLKPGQYLGFIGRGVEGDAYVDLSMLSGARVKFDGVKEPQTATPLGGLRSNNLARDERGRTIQIGLHSMDSLIIGPAANA
jgi:hypothetical protein